MGRPPKIQNKNQSDDRLNDTSSSKQSLFIQSPNFLIIQEYRIKYKKQKINKTFDNNSDKIDEESIFHDEESCFQVEKKQHIHKINQPLQSKNVKTKEENSISISNSLDSQNSDVASENQSNKQPLTRSKTNFNIVVQKKVEENSEDKFNKDETFQDNLVKKQKRKRKYKKKNSLNEQNNNDDESLVDLDSLLKKRNKSISKYGNKKGRKKIHEKDHFLPLEDTQIVEVLRNTLLEYEYNYGFPKNKEQNLNSQDSQNINIKSEDHSTINKLETFQNSLDTQLCGKSSNQSKQSLPILNYQEDNNTYQHDSSIYNEQIPYDNQLSQTSNGQNSFNESLISSDLNSVFIQKVKVEPDENKNPQTTQTSDFNMTSNLIRFQQLERLLQERKSLNQSNQGVKKQNRSYKLSEDLKMIYIMSEKEHNINGYSSQYWSKVVNNKLIDRPHESLRDRYKRFIKYLNKDNILDIFKWISNHKSIEGYLNFIKFQNNFKKFSHVTVEDPFASKKQLNSGNTIHETKNKFTEEGQVKNVNESNDQKQQVLNLQKQKIQNQENFSRQNKIQQQYQTQSSYIKSEDPQTLIKSESIFINQQSNPQKQRSNQNDSEQQMKKENNFDYGNNNIVLQHLNSENRHDRECQILNQQNSHYKMIKQQNVFDKTGVMHIININSESGNEFFEELQLKDQYIKRQDKFQQNQTNLEQYKLKQEYSQIKIENSQNNTQHQYQCRQLQQMNNCQHNSISPNFSIKKNQQEISIDQSYVLNNSSNILGDYNFHAQNSFNSNIQQQENFNSIFNNLDNNQNKITQNQLYTYKQYKENTSEQQKGNLYQQYEYCQISKLIENHINQEQYEDNSDLQQQQYVFNPIYETNKINQKYYSDKQNIYGISNNQQFQNINNEYFRNNLNQQQKQVNDNLQLPQQFDQQDYYRVNIFQQQPNERQNQQHVKNNCNIILNEFNQCRQNVDYNNQNQFQNNQNIQYYFEGQQRIDSNQTNQINNNQVIQLNELNQHQQIVDNNQFEQKQENLYNEQSIDNDQYNYQKHINYSNSQSNESYQSYLQYFNDDLNKEQYENEQINTNTNNKNNINNNYYNHSRIYFDE